MAKFPKIVTPKGTAAYAWLNKPDDKYNADKPKYKLTLVIDKDSEAAEAFKAKVRELGEKAAEDNDIFIGVSPKMPWEDGDVKNKKLVKKDKDAKEEFKGKLLITATSQYRPGQVDAKRAELPDNIFVMSGDTVKFSALVKPYDGFGGGVSLQLRNVQLLEKNAGTGYPALDFDDEDGYEAGGDDPDDY